MGEYGWSSKAISDTCPGMSSPLAWMARMVPTAINKNGADPAQAAADAQAAAEQAIADMQ